MYISYWVEDKFLIIQKPLLQKPLQWSDFTGVRFESFSLGIHFFVWPEVFDVVCIFKNPSLKLTHQRGSKFYLVFFFFLFFSDRNCIKDKPFEENCSLHMKLLFNAASDVGVQMNLFDLYRQIDTNFAAFLQMPLSWLHVFLHSLSLFFFFSLALSWSVPSTLAFSSSCCFDISFMKCAYAH